MMPRQFVDKAASCLLGSCMALLLPLILPDEPPYGNEFHYTHLSFVILVLYTL